MTSMSRNAVRWKAVACLVAGAALGGCNSLDGPTNGNGGPDLLGDVVVLNSVGKTFTQYDVDGTITPVGPARALPPNFDGDAMDVLDRLFVSTISSFGGSRVVFADLTTGETSIASFPGTVEANPSRPTIIIDIRGNVGTLVAGRGTNAIYIVFPGGAEAQAIATDVGTFVQRVLPAGNFLFALDANLDDDGGTFEPLGNSKILVIDLLTGSLDSEIDIPGAKGAVDALFTGETEVLVLAGGTFGADFSPNGDGLVALVNVAVEIVAKSFDLGGNGISIRPGADSQVYITRTTDFVDIDVLSWNSSVRNFVRGPDNPIEPKDSDGSKLACWAVSALFDGRLLCVTFDVVQSGRLVLLDEDGQYIAEAASGFGSTDLAFP